LAYADPAKEYILDTEASDHNVRAVLSQVQDFSAAEKNHCTTKKELLAVTKAVKHFILYFCGRMFQMRTDQASLI